MKDFGREKDDICFLAEVIGTALMQRMLEELKLRGYEKTSLSVQKDNYAVKMYRNVGFEIVEEKEEEYMMICYL